MFAEVRGARWFPRVGLLRYAIPKIGRAKAIDSARE